MHTFDDYIKKRGSKIRSRYMLTNHKAMRPFALVSGHYLHILSKGMTLTKTHEYHEDFGGK